MRLGKDQDWSTGSWTGYRADIDGLRAVAVLAVMGFHAAPAQVRSGFIGVDIFFVISGFLITRIVVRASGRPGWLGTFYARRIRRLVPALLLVLVISTAAAALVLTSPDFETYLRHLLAAAFFVPNHVFMLEFGYFVSSDAKPLLHLWSLGVEEQFYLVWPVVLAAALRRKRAVLLIASVLSVSFVLSVLGAMAFPDANFYSPLARGWQLASGAAVAFWLARQRPLTGAAAHALSLGGAFLLVVGLTIIIPGGGYPSWTAVLPTAAAALFIAAGPAGWVNRHLLASRPAVAVGLISYPLYLWHWPLLSFASSLGLEKLPWTWALAAITVSFPAAWATYRFVEQPARRGGAKTVAFLVGGMAALGLVAALWMQAPTSLRPEADPRREFVAHYRHMPVRIAASTDDCSLTRGRRWMPSQLPAQCTPVGRSGTWLLLGDSHAQALAPGLRTAMPDGVALAVLTGPGCAPLAEHGALCAATSRHAISLVKRLRPDIVLLVQQGGHELRNWDDIGEKLRTAGAGRAIVVGPVPQWTRALPQIAVTRYWPTVPPFIATELDETVIASDRWLRDRSAPGTPSISLIEDLCSPGGCRAVVPDRRPNALIHFDYGHLTSEGSNFVAREILVPKISGRQSERR